MDTVPGIVQRTRLHRLPKLPPNFAGARDYKIQKGQILQRQAQALLMSSVTTNKTSRLSKLAVIHEIPHSVHDRLLRLQRFRHAPLLDRNSTVCVAARFVWHFGFLDSPKHVSNSR